MGVKKDPLVQRWCGGGSKAVVERWLGEKEVQECRMASGDSAAEKAKGVGLNFKTSSDLSMMLMFTGLLLGADAHCISTEVSPRAM